MSVAFSSSETVALLRRIDVDSKLKQTTSNQLKNAYELEKCIKWIKNKNFSKIALQFPDQLLIDSAAIALYLEKYTKVQIFILGDTSYGSCCVDEIAAEHVSADAIIHYGHACLSPTNRLPVLYVFGQQPLDCTHAAEEFRHLFPDKQQNVIIFYEVFYVYAIGKLEEILKCEYKNLIISELQLPQEKPCCFNTEIKEEQNVAKIGVASNKDDFEISKCGRCFKIPVSYKMCDYSMFHIGTENQTLTNLMLTFSHNKFYSYDPCKRVGRQETLDVNRYLRKRYYYIERAKDAKVIGILVGTLGVSDYLSVISHLKVLIKQAGKKSYTLVIGKLNNAKAANFSEIEVFVLVSCPETSLIDCHEFYQPIITPFELEIACNQARQWTGNYVTDFRELLPGAVSHVILNPRQQAEGDVSLVTGKIRSLGTTNENNLKGNYDSAIALRNDMTISNIHSQGAGEYLASRTWYGLEQRLGETPIAEIVQGKKGIASGYEDEMVNDLLHDKETIS